MQEFLAELEQLDCKYSSPEAKEFFKMYGCSQPIVGVSTLTLCQCLGKSQRKRPRSCLRSGERSRRLSQSMSNGSKLYHEDLGPAPQDKASFLEQILGCFGDLWETADFFFVDRDNLSYEEFRESCSSLGVCEVFPELSKIFSEISAGALYLDRDKLVRNLQGENVGEDPLRRQLKERFGSVLDAFVYLTDRSSALMSRNLYLKLKSLHIHCSQAKLKELFPQNTLGFNEFKRFWCQSSDFCAVKSCEKRKKTSYCAQHSDSLVTRAAAFLDRLTSRIRKELWKSLKDNPGAQAIRNKIEELAPGILYTKKDVVALQEYARTKDFVREFNRTAKRSRSPHLRTEQIPSRAFSFSKSPMRRIVRLK